MAASLMGVNTTIKGFPAALSLSTNCKAFSLSTTCKALSSSSRVEQKKWFDKVNGMVDGFDKESMKAKEMSEYDTKLKKLLDKAEYDAVLLNEVKILHASFVLVIEKRRKASDLVEQVNQLLDWFENETMEAKEIIDKLRKEYHIFINSEGAEEKTVLFADLEVMFWYLSVKQAKTIRTKIKAGYRSEMPLTKLYRKLYPKWKVEDTIDGVNQLLDWFDKEIMEAKGTTQILRIKSEIIAQKLFKEWEDVDVLFEDSKDMFWNLKKKQAKAIVAKSKTAKFTHEVPKVAKLLCPLRLL